MENEEKALKVLLAQSGLSDPKWFKCFNDMGIMQPDDIFTSEAKEELYQNALSIASETEERLLQKLFGVTDAKSVFVKVYKALEDAGLDALYWSRVLTIQAGVITEQALRYIDDGFYPHLVQFARFAEERRALCKLLNIEKCEHSISSQYEAHGKRFEERKQAIEQCISKLKEFQEDKKDFSSTVVQEVKQRALECLQIPEEFWLRDSSYESFLQQIFVFNQQMTSALEIKEFFNDSQIVQSASSGLALKGVYSLYGKEIRHSRNDLIEVPKNVVMHNPFFSQYVKYVTLPDSDTEWELSVEEELFSNYVHCTDKFWTIKTFVVPVSSCFFRATELKLTDKAVTKLMEVEKLGKSDVSFMEKECRLFFEEFGSCVSLGPFHFGGHYHWCCCSTRTEDTDISAMKQLHNEAIKCLETCSSIEVPEWKHVRMIPGFNTTNYCESLVRQTSINVGVCGGPQVCSVAIWRNRLVLEKHTWVLLDVGNEKISVWDIITKNHADDFDNAPLLAETMRRVSLQINMNPFERKLSNFESHLKTFVQYLKEWSKNKSRMKYFQQLLNYMKETREEIITKEMDLETWPTCYLSQAPVQQCLVLLVSEIEQKHQESEKIRYTLCLVIRPSDLEAIPEFSEKDRFRHSVFQMNETLEACDLNEMGKICELSSKLLHRNKDSSEADHDVVSHPKRSLRATAILTKALSHIRSHLHRTGQVYDDLLILALLIPFNYQQESNIFLSCFTDSDMTALGNQFRKQAEHFIRLKNLMDNKKLQAHLILLTMNMYHEFDVTISNVQAFFKHMLKIIPNDDSDESINDILTSLSKNAAAMDSAKVQLHYILKGITTDPNSTSLKKVLAVDVVEKDMDVNAGMALLAGSAHANIFSMLNLTNFFPQKLSLAHALQIKKEILVSSDSQKNPNRCCDPALYPSLVLQRVMSFDSRCRMMLTKGATIDTATMADDSESSDGEDENESYIHPMDGLLALLYCSDNFLRQDLLCRLATCQISIPLILPIPSSEELTFLLWAMRTIVKQWKSSSGGEYQSHELPIVSYRAPIISFFRFGTHSLSKSRMMNVVINDSRQDTFFDYDSDGGSAKKVFVPGLADVGWYLPSVTNNTFKDAITFVNMHGDGRDFLKQTMFLSKVSFMMFVFLNEDGLDDFGCELLRNMSNAPGGLVLLRTKPEGKGLTEKFKHLKQELTKERCTIIKLSRKNEAQIKDSIRAEITRGIDQYWQGQSKVHPTLEECKDIATKCGITVDENQSDCVKGKQMAYELKSVIVAYKMENPSKSPKELLPLQGSELWHEWAAKEKEVYRHKKGGMQSIEEHAMHLREDMEIIRKIQVRHAHNLTPLMESFLTTLLSHEKNTRQYYLQWTKIVLDDLSREILPPLHKEYRKRRKEMIELQQEKIKNIAAIEKCKLDMEKINKSLIYASFGLEHLLREMGQLFEAMSCQEESFQDLIVRLPNVAAELLIEGHPLELMDGDAAHVPLTWVTAVLKQVQEILRNPSIVVLSILGLQSTGKSTLLNTLFGVRFSVSAGRCTRGAFMQLVPLDHTLQQECKCEYFLLVDTEGLRAPELDAMKTQNHDNELATFVIGLANLTVINIYGETPGDLDDILQTSVHAFLRMKAVKLRPGCHFVHQNVSAVMAGEKGMMGRFNFKTKLDEMTAAAAKEEHLESEYSTFNEVIRFNDEKDVTHFPNLWRGDPPMAPVNFGYSFKAITLKSKLVDFAREMSAGHHIIVLSQFVNMLKQFWKAVLYENFVFSFKNTLESSTYTFLDTQFGKWSWSYQQDMLEREHDLATTMANSSEDPQASTIFKEAKSMLFEETGRKYQALKAEMEKFFAERPEREILIKWKSETETQLRHVREQLMRHATTHCEQVWKTYLAKVKMTEIASNHRIVIVSRVKALVSDLQEKLAHKQLGEKLNGKLTDQELEDKFENQWQEWIRELQKMSVQTQAEEKDIKSDVQSSLRKLFKAEDSMLIRKQDAAQGGMSLEEWGEKTPQLENKHVIVKGRFDWLKSKVGFTTWEPLVSEQTKAFFDEVQMYLDTLKNRDFHPSFTNKVIQILKEGIDTFKKNNKGLELTKEYKIEMALILCGYALVRFQIMVTQFREQNDLVKCFEHQKKRKYLQMFKYLYNQTAQELAVARLFCSDIEHQVRKEVFNRLSLKIVSHLRDDREPVYIGEKRVLIQKILQRIGQDLRNHNFDSCSRYIMHPSLSISSWIRKFTEEFCDHGQQSRRISVIANRILEELMKAIRDTAKAVTNTFVVRGDTFQIVVWIGKFTDRLRRKLELDRSEMCEQGGVQQLGDINYFTNELLKGLKIVENTLQDEFQLLTSASLERCIVTPYATLDDGVNAVSGCRESCPFCHEPCSRAKDHGGDHLVEGNRHRPQCLGGVRYRGTEEMVLTTCNAEVYDNRSFYKDQTTHILHPYRRASEIYPGWKIEASTPGESLNYWKYVVAQYKQTLMELYNMEGSKIPTDWQKLELSNALADFAA